MRKGAFMSKKGVSIQCTDEDFANELFKLYTQNSFGAISKRELDLFLFSKFKAMNKISGKTSWDLAKELKISKNKAQTLLYESELRYSSQEENDQVQQVLNHIPKSFEKGVVFLIVDNRYAKDCMRDFLAEIGYVTDLSFASDIIKMPVDAYWKLLEKYNSNVIKSLEKERFIQELKSLGKSAVLEFAATIGGETGRQATQLTVETFFRFIKKKIKQ